MILSVDILKHKMVGDLKNMIKDHTQNTFAGLDAHCLHLWKASIAMKDYAM